MGDLVSPNTSTLYIPQDSAGMGVLILEGKFAKQKATLQKNVWVSERTLFDAFSIGARPKGDQVHDVHDELHFLLPQAPLPHL